MASKPRGILTWEMLCISVFLNLRKLYFRRMFIVKIDEKENMPQ